MGDRANIQFVEPRGGKLFFYTHWTGTELPETLAAALDRGRGRWNDEQYLARIIFSEMVKDDVDGETGYGIGTERGDYNYDDIIVDVAAQHVTDRDGYTYTFEDFVAKHLPKHSTRV